MHCTLQNHISWSLAFWLPADSFMSFCPPKLMATFTIKKNQFKYLQLVLRSRCEKILSDENYLIFYNSISYFSRSKHTSSMNGIDDLWTNFVMRTSSCYRSGKVPILYIYTSVGIEM